MRTVTLSEIVPGMVLYPFDGVNKNFTKPDNFFGHIIIAKVTEANTDPFWGDCVALHFIGVRDCNMGICSTGYPAARSDIHMWVVEDEQPVLDAIRVHMKTEINAMRDHFDECERLIDVNC